MTYIDKKEDNDVSELPHKHNNGLKDPVFEVVSQRLDFEAGCGEGRRGQQTRR